MHSNCLFQEKQKSSRKVHKIDVIYIKLSTFIKVVVIAEDMIIVIYFLKIFLLMSNSLRSKTETFLKSCTSLDTLLKLLL